MQLIAGIPMIISNKIEKVDDGWRILLYDTNEDGKCAPSLRRSDSHEDINIYYAQQAKRLDALVEKLIGNEISPLGLFVDYFRMSVKDLAARAKLSPSSVKKHLTPAGFAKAKVDDLQAYARVFDITVSDFFVFIHLPHDLKCEAKKFNNRLVQQVVITEKKGQPKKS